MLGKSIIRSLIGHTVNARYLEPDVLKYIQSNFNGSNSFGTIKISSRQGLFEPMRVDYSARSGGIIGISFQFSSK